MSHSSEGKSSFYLVIKTWSSFVRGFFGVVLVASQKWLVFTAQVDICMCIAYDVFREGP
jgi:hypothetical protein